MRGARSIITYLRYAMSNKTIVLAAFLLSLTGTVIAGVYNSNQQNAYAIVQDCSDNSIVRCGIANYAQLTQKYDANEHGDLRAIYDHYWIKRVPAAGDQVIQGWAKNDGTVVANGRVVATNAASIGRQAISGSHPISIANKTYYQTTHVGGQAFKPGTTQLETLIVLDAAGNFKYAVINGCGNPIYATPVPPPTPQPVNIEVCDLDTLKIVTIKETDFDQSRHSKNLEDCTPPPAEIEVCDLKTMQIITISEDKFDKTRHSKNLEDCTLPPAQIEVCDLKTKRLITINEDEFNVVRHSKTLSDCDEQVVEYVKVCDTELMRVVQVTKEMAKESRYTTDLSKCTPPPAPEKPKPEVVVKTVTKVVEKPVAAPQELPKTGTGDFFVGGLGLVSMTLAAYYYALSRR